MLAPIATLKPVRTCKTCGESMRPTRGDLRYLHGDFEVIVQNVPMSVCESCGERYVPGSVGLEIGDLVDGIVRYFETKPEMTSAAVRPQSLVLNADQMRSAFGLS